MKLCFEGHLHRLTSMLKNTSLASSDSSVLCLLHSIAHSTWGVIECSSSSTSFNFLHNYFLVDQWAILHFTSVSSHDAVCMEVSWNIYKKRWIWCCLHKQVRHSASYQQSQYSCLWKVDPRSHIHMQMIVFHISVKRHQELTSSVFPSHLLSSDSRLEERLRWWQKERERWEIHRKVWSCKLQILPWKYSLLLSLFWCCEINKKCVLSLPLCR